MKPHFLDRELDRGRILRHLPIKSALAQAFRSIENVGPASTCMKRQSVVYNRDRRPLPAITQHVFLRSRRWAK
jgi:hypothetical protein